MLRSLVDDLRTTMMAMPLVVGRPMRQRNICGFPFIQSKVEMWRRHTRYA
jgi:hypothetical protein